MVELMGQNTVEAQTPVVKKQISYDAMNDIVQNIMNKVRQA
jgi:hypothetical protein